MLKNILFAALWAGIGSGGMWLWLDGRHQLELSDMKRSAYTNGYVAAFPEAAKVAKESCDERMEKLGDTIIHDLNETMDCVMK